MYKKLPKAVREAIDEKISWLYTYLWMAKEYGYDKSSVQEAKRKLKVLETFKNT